MKFKYSCFTENTPENREWLEKLGYKSVHSTYGSFLYTSLTLNEWSFMATSDRCILPNSFIDCRSNPSLFKAVSAIRDDSDYMQWFVCDISLSDCATSKGEFELSYDKQFQTSRMDGSFWHKATLSELIEKFK